MRRTQVNALVASTLMIVLPICAAKADPAADAKVVAEATQGRLEVRNGTYFDKDYEGAVECAAEVIDLNGDGQPEVFTKCYGSMFGMAGVQLDLLIKAKSGKWVLQFGFPGAHRILEAKSDGYPDIEIEGPGTCLPVWRWNGSAYAIHKRCDR